jgi:hypothetical protein
MTTQMLTKNSPTATIAVLVAVFNIPPLPSLQLLRLVVAAGANTTCVDRLPFKRAISDPTNFLGKRRVPALSTFHFEARVST